MARSTLIGARINQARGLTLTRPNKVTFPPLRHIQGETRGPRGNQPPGLPVQRTAGRKLVVKAMGDPTADAHARRRAAGGTTSVPRFAQKQYTTGGQGRVRRHPNKHF